MCLTAIFADVRGLLRPADFPAVGDVPLDGVMTDRALIHLLGRS
jgi:hypothetical protein